LSTLVFLEHHGSAIQKGALGVLSKAASLDPDTAGVLIGSGVRELAALLKLPLMSSAAKIEPDVDAGTVRVRRISATGFDVLEAPMPALIVGTQLLGEPRYPSLKGIMAARSKEITSLTLADLGIEASSVGVEGATTKVTDWRAPAPRGATEVVREAPDEAARRIVALLAERRII
jgi:electron transfer flavoprotein beta subunit